MHRLEIVQGVRIVLPLADYYLQLLLTGHDVQYFLLKSASPSLSRVIGVLAGFAIL